MRASVFGSISRMSEVDGLVDPSRCVVHGSGFYLTLLGVWCRQKPAWPRRSLLQGQTMHVFLVVRLLGVWCRRKSEMALRGLEGQMCDWYLWVFWCGQSLGRQPTAVCGGG